MDKENICIHTHTHVCVYIFYCCVNVCIYVYIFLQWNTIQYKNMRSSSFAKTWVDLEGIRISEKKYKRQITLGFHSYVEYKNQTKMIKPKQNK